MKSSYASSVTLYCFVLSVESTVLFCFAIHHAFLAHGLFNSRKELSFLIMMVFCYTFMPSKTIADEIIVVRWLNAGSLLVNTIEPADERVVA